MDKKSQWNQTNLFKNKNLKNQLKKEKKWKNY